MSWRKAMSQLAWLVFVAALLGSATPAMAQCSSVYPFTTRCSLPAAGLNAILASVIAAAADALSVANSKMTTDASNANAASVRANLGLGTAARKDTGTSGNTLPFLDGDNTFSGTQTFGPVVGAVNIQSGTTYTLAVSDCGKTVRFTSGSAITLTTLNSLPPGCSIAVLQAGAGQVTIANGSGATSHSAHSYTKTFGQYSVIGLFVDANSGGSAADFIITGDGA